MINVVVIFLQCTKRVLNVIYTLLDKEPLQTLMNKLRGFFIFISER